MLGAIIGDIVGSVYEWHNIKTKDFPLFREDCFFTDDTVMTVATADALMNGGEKDDFIDAYKKWGRMYPNAGYGGRFGAWLNSGDRTPYNSFGNGSAMRVSPCAWVCKQTQFAHECIDDVHALSKACAAVTHNHPEGLRGAHETAQAVWLMLRSRCYDDYPNNVDEWKERVRQLSSYDLSKSLAEIRPAYRFNETCQETVPQAIIAFLESTDFEDAIRNAISLGGDSDTLACIAGGIAEAYFGVPENLKQQARGRLDERLLGVLDEFINISTRH